MALGDPHRQRIVLMFEPGERLNIGQIVAASTLSRTAVAHHLRVLREAGVLNSEKSAVRSISGPTRMPCARRWTRRGDV